MTVNYVDIVGIGIGPSNLSLAALLHMQLSSSFLFFDKKERFSWHDGMQLPFSKIQVSYLKDLVTLINPQNPYSFLSFLAHEKRLYQFLNANMKEVSREEFSQYYEWVCLKLSAYLLFNDEVCRIMLSRGIFRIFTTKKEVFSPVVVLGNGLSPNIPTAAKNLLSPTIFHSSTFMHHTHHFQNKKIVIVGGGQSGAEIIAYLLSLNKNIPEKIYWLTRRDNYFPLDNSPFVNELFTPAYSDYFYSLSSLDKSRILKKQKYFSDGISHATLKEIYQRLYNIYFIKNKKSLFALLTESEIFNIEKKATWELNIKNIYSHQHSTINADIIILCTGYRYVLPQFLNSIVHHFEKDKEDNLIINEDFSLKTDLPASCKIYIQNGAFHSRGIADPNLSLIPWRSAKIINSIYKKSLYDLSESISFLNWQSFTSD